MTMAVTATTPGVARVKVTAAAPEGWTVEPEQDVTMIRSNGKPTEGKVPLTVTIPAGTKKGDYTVEAVATTPGAKPVRAVATIQVTDSIEFDTGTKEETRWLFDADSSQFDGDNRYADNDHYFTYRFPLPAETSKATATLDIDNQFRVEVSSDGENWTEVLVEEREIHDGENRAERTVDLAPFLGEGNGVYLKVSDSFPEDGWGGRVKHVAVTMSDS